MIDETLVSTLMGSQPLAQRVFVHVPNTGICVCDYMFPSETEAAVKERVSKWVGFSILDGQLQVTQELVQGYLQWPRGRYGQHMAASLQASAEA